TGPWRIGHLDEYDGTDWRLPPFAASELEEVPRSGVVDSELIPGVKATFEMGDLGGAVLPGLPNTVGIVAKGPKVAFDPRLGNIRLSQGSVERGLEYTVVAAVVPTVEELRDVDQPVPQEIRPFLEIPEPPPAVQDLLSKAPKDNLFDKMNFLRETLLRTVVSTGAGTPDSVTSESVQDMLAGSKEGTPFEIVAAQAMLARWAGVPSRIAYGYDGGEKVEDLLEIRPKHGSSFLEVYFPTYKWVPVIGTPLQAKSSLTNDPQQFNSNVLASNDLAVRIHIPIALDRGTLLFAQVRRVLLIVLPIVLAVLFVYYSWPAAWKAVLRSRRRNWAHEQGAAARIMVAYGEWRDTSTDFGYRWDADTPLMFLDRIVDDEEHAELAWLVTRTLWGDLRDEISEQDANAAEELSKSLRRRLGQAHSFTLRTIAAVSRLSLRYPHVPLLLERPTTRKRSEYELQPA
ncbi:MAG: transglutaminaseTgpA domain-containing protein, partial [Actinomycetota bacterium]